MKRNITILLDSNDYKDIFKLKSYCRRNLLEFKFRYKRHKNKISIQNEKDISEKESLNNEEKLEWLYYFYIEGDTEDFNNLNKYMENKLVLTDYAEICNIANQGNLFEHQLKICLNLLRESQNASQKASKKLLDFIMPIKDVNVLIKLKEYEGIMNEHQKQIINDRIAILNGNNHYFEEEMTESILSLDCDVKVLREKTGMNRKEFCNYFGIPYRTVEDWENKKSTCSTYLFRLMKEKLENNKLI